QQNLRNANTAYLIIKFRNQTHTYYTVRNISLLDLSSYTTNATPGGYLLGQLQPTTTLPENTPLLATTNNNHLLTLYFLENNSISDDNTPTLPGYYKLAVPLGKHYTIKYLNQNLTSQMLQKNLQVQPGEYTHYLKSELDHYTTTPYEPLTIPIFLHNNGAFTDTYTITVAHSSTTWTTTHTPTSISLAPHEISIITVTTMPHPPKPGTSTELQIQSHSLTDPIAGDTLTLKITLDAPDLLPTNISLWDSHSHKQQQFIQGQQIRIKAHIKNQGTINATNATIAFYHRHHNITTFLGSQQYISISNYYKYPSILFDTTGIPAGTHTIQVITDPSNTVLEADETNNKYTLHYTLIPLIYDTNATALKITELYYHTHPNLHNEYIALYNPTSYHLNMSGWYLTSTPEKRAIDQYKILFPTPTIIPPYATWYITQNATAFYHQTGYLPNYEYEVDAQTTIPNLNTSHTIILSNTKGTVALKSPSNITIDLVCYGTTNILNTTWWIDGPLPLLGTGRILKRVLINNLPLDTNSSCDWNHNRIYKIGQSTFTPAEYTFYGSVTPFVSPDCSHRTLIQEIAQAQHTIYLNMYEFTSPTLFQALLEALHRNISIKIFMEGSPIGGIDEREQYILMKLHYAGAQIRFIVSDASKKIYARYPFNHAKYLILDNATVIVESCNWVKTGVPSDPSFGNREWGIVIHNIQIAEYFNAVFAHDYNPFCVDSCSIASKDFQLSDSFMLDTSAPQGNYVPCFNNTKYQGNFTIIPIFSPDTSNSSICQLIDSAHECIYVQQLYIYPNWTDGQNPFVSRLIEKAKEGLDIRVILNYNPVYEPSNEKINLTKKQLTKYGIKVKYLYTNWSIFTNSHTKGMIVDNTTVLISSINWNENSVLNNREAGLIVENPDVATYFAEVFFHDWELSEPIYQQDFSFSIVDFKNQILIVGVYTFTLALIIRDWRKRQWN
ncbi:MAG: lamin tail domain-containing protein, partial [Candidatus Thermoplasmatota archaeon]|nr:lamin tail domain-containing protein [Candidatus Thermoplasmatota archaeon]